MKKKTNMSIKIKISFFIFYFFHSATSYSFLLRLKMLVLCVDDDDVAGCKKKSIVAVAPLMMLMIFQLCSLAMIKMLRLRLWCLSALAYTIKVREVPSSVP